MNKRVCYSLTGTRIVFWDVASWIDGYNVLKARPPSKLRYQQIEGMLSGLTREFIELEDDERALGRLREVFQAAGAGLKPARGQRAGSRYELVICAVHDRLAALRRTTSCSALPQHSMVEPDLV